MPPIIGMGTRVPGEPALELAESKLRPPWTRPGIVHRTALVERLLAAPAAAIIWVVAPPGYGKTTLLTQCAVKGGHMGWVTVDQRDNDPVVLLSYLAVALDRIEPIDPMLFDALAAPGASVAGTIVPRLATAVAAMTRPIALVIDNLEVLTNRACLDAMAEVVARLPTGSQLALAARTNPRLPAALVGGPGRVMAVGVEELRMDQDEAHALVEGAGVQLDDAQTAALVGLREGWPVGLYLAALARTPRRAGGPQKETGAELSGDDRPLADYLWAELLSDQPQPTVWFLTRTAVLDRMCGPRRGPGHHRLGRPVGVAGRVEPVGDPPDQQQQWYRYHHLFRGLLQAELKRREPELVPQSCMYGRRCGVRPTGWPRAPSIMPRPPGTPTWSPGWSPTGCSPPTPTGASTPPSAGSAGSTRG